MKTLFLAALLLIPSVASADDWTSADSTREATYLVLLATDWAQTRSFLRSDKNCRARQPKLDSNLTCTATTEMNPLLGGHPHKDKVDITILATAIAHVYVASILPANYRKAWQYISIGVEAGAVAHNYSIGIKARF